ncbi:SWIM zinc finger family protein [Streptomyces sp. NPDC047000]|uniref:SWIM zinc finger family protein n=1 Tax=Streptomyces sp. NPDC047000 TaxID=3155474 RepID=UPI0033F795BA
MPDREEPYSRPVDAARRALRASRQRGSAPDRTEAAGPARVPPGADVAGGSERRRSGEAQGVGPSGYDTGRGAPPRPGDIARAALRRAVSARRGAAAGTEPPDGADTPAPHPVGTAGAAREHLAGDHLAEGTGPGPGRPGTGASGDRRRPGRPGDVAREALRAAREEALRERRRESEEAGDDAAPAADRGTGPASGTAPGPSRPAAPGAAAARTPPAEAAAPALGSARGDAAAAGHLAFADDPRPAAASRPSRLPSMASPRRDGDLRRTFPAFPPRAGNGAAPGFAESWWGNAWVEALEQGALDVKRLARGRDYALGGHVDAITVTPGQVLAYVQGSRPRPYRVQLLLRTLDDTDWEHALDAAADRPGHIAALLDKELPRSLADCGVPLLPGPGDLEPRCNCPDHGFPCKHAAALCYQTARLLDADPFVLLLLRGRGERTLLDALSRRNATREARAAQTQEPAALPGVRASETLAAGRDLPPLPTPLPVPAHPGQPPAYPAAPDGPDPFALDQLATDAAARAHALLVTGRDPVGELTLWQDAVRLAAARPGSGLTAATRGLYAALTAATGRTTADLARAVAAWRQGGLEGLAVLEEPWDPPAGRFDRARPLLLAADHPRFRPWRNRLTHPLGHVQLRFGRDGLWYGYESEPGRDTWWPRGTPDPDPVGALTGMVAPTGP